MADEEAEDREETQPRRRRRARPYIGGGVGAMLSGAMLGLRDVLEDPPEDEIVMVQDAGEPEGPQPVEVHLDPDSPPDSTVTVRRHLL